MLKIENGRLGLYGTEHSKYNHLMTLCFKEIRHRDELTDVQTHRQTGGWTTKKHSFQHYSNSGEGAKTRYLLYVTAGVVGL